MPLRSTIEILEARLAPAAVILGTDTVPSGSVNLASSDSVAATVNDVAGSGQLVVTGTVALGGASLALDVSAPPANRESFILIENDDTDPITGIFAGLPEGRVFLADGSYFKISYEGGDGNDVELRALVPDLKIAANGRSATFTDVDGDVVTIKTNKGSLSPDDITLVPTGDFLEGSQLTRLRLGASTLGATVTISARRDFLEGNSLVNVGAIDGTGVNLIGLTVKGDLGRITVGDGVGTSAALKTLNVQSMGMLGTSTQGGGAATLESTFAGRLGSLSVKTSLSDVSLTSPKGFGSITIGGSLIRSEIASGADIGALTVRHDVIGEKGLEVKVQAYGQAAAPKQGLDLAIKSITVGGRLERALITAGYDLAGVDANADASVGPVKVGGDWVASSLTAGAGPGTDGFIGTGANQRFDGAGLVTVRDQGKVLAQIASVTVSGQVLGTANDPSDTFGIVAEWVRSLRIGGVAVQLTPTIQDDFIAIAPTGPGATGLRSDVYLVEAQSAS